MNEAELLAALKAVKTMPELDAMRGDVVDAMKAAAKRDGNAGFRHIQNSFISAKNRLTRIPLADRSW